jgi:hypothetical protein
VDIINLTSSRKSYTPHTSPLSAEEMDAIIEHLQRGGHPLTAAPTCGVSADRLQDEFVNNASFANRCTMVRAQALAKLEYSLYDIATTIDEDSSLSTNLKAISLILSSQLGELYGVNSKTVEEKIKKIVG